MESNQKRYKYVYLRKGAIFVALGDVKKGKYSYHVFAKPINGYFYDKETKKIIKAEEFDDAVVIDLPEDFPIEDLSKGKIVVFGIPKDKVVIVEKSKEYE